MAKPILYSVEVSPPVRAVRLVAAALEVDLEIKPVDLFGGEHLQEPYLKLNPQHTVPTLDDDGKVIWDSHAIAGYLVNAYGKDDSLYPSDPHTRARVDQRLHFDTGILFNRLRDANIAIMRGGCTEVPQEKLDVISEAYDLLEIFLADDPYLVGDSLTIADLCSIPTVTSLEYHVPIDAEKYPKIAEWVARICELPYYEESSGQYAPQLAGFLDQKKAENGA